MSEIKTNRSLLYNLESDYDSDTSDYVVPKLEFELKEVEENDNEDNKGGIQESNGSDAEFDFPLFAASDTVVEDRGRSKEAKPSIMKVSLREQSEERVINERPESFYFAKYTDKQREQFQQCAVSSDDIYQQMYIVDTQPWKCLNLNEYNAKIESEIARQKAKCRKNRPGKKKRQLKIVCRQRKLEKAKMKKLEEEKLKKLMKKQKFQQKFNGKPNQRQGKGRKPMAGNKTTTETKI